MGEKKAVEGLSAYFPTLTRKNYDLDDRATNVHAPVLRITDTRHSPDVPFQ